MSLEETLAGRFVCAKCKHHGGKARTVAATGSGLSKLFDIQHNKFVAVSCNHCGYTEFYDPRVLGDQSALGTVLDVIFER